MATAVVYPALFVNYVMCFIGSGADMYLNAAVRSRSRPISPCYHRSAGIFAVPQINAECVDRVNADEFLLDSRLGDDGEKFFRLEGDRWIFFMTGNGTFGFVGVEFDKEYILRCLLARDYLGPWLISCCVRGHIRYHGFRK